MSRTKRIVQRMKAAKAAAKMIEKGGIPVLEIFDKVAKMNDKEGITAPEVIDKAAKMIDVDVITAPEIVDKSTLDNALDNAPDNVNDDYDDDAPEIVTSNMEDIKKLRDLHEQMMLPAEKRTKKRKSTKNLSIIADVKKFSEEEELDDSVLAALDGLNEKESSTRDGDKGGRKDAEDFKRMTRTLSKRKRKGIINIHAKKSRKM
jgi:hypothetical protein